MTFNYPPRPGVWALVSTIDNEGQATVQHALELLQEALYCIEGVVTPIQQPSNPEERRLLSSAFSQAHHAFTNYYYER
jgi:hypothetical protein